MVVVYNIIGADYPVTLHMFHTHTRTHTHTHII